MIFFKGILCVMIHNTDIWLYLRYKANGSTYLVGSGLIKCSINSCFTSSRMWNSDEFGDQSAKCANLCELRRETNLIIPFHYSTVSYVRSK